MNSSERSTKTIKHSDKCQNIHILAINLHLLIFDILLHFISFCVFYIFIGHGRKESVSRI